MKVSDLILALQEADPNKEVIIYDNYDSSYHSIETYMLYENDQFWIAFNC